MDRFFRLLYYYCLFMLIVIVLYLSFALAVSPKKDALKRGFIPCTENFVYSVGECERGQMGCLASKLWTDTKCNLYVIADGLGAWIKGNQSTPWENYFFTPLVEAELDAENPYIGDVEHDFDDLEKQRAFFEQKEKELEQAKNRKISDVVLQGDSEQDAINDAHYINEEVVDVEEHGDINDETVIGEISMQDQSDVNKPNDKEKK